MHRRKAAQTLALMAALAIVAGGAQNCDPGGSTQNACNAFISQGPRVVRISEDILVEARVDAECREQQQRHSVQIRLDRENEQHRWVQVRTIVENQIPTVGKTLEIPISTTDCVPGRWRVRFHVVGTSKGGVRYRYPQSGDKSKTSRAIRCD